MLWHGALLFELSLNADYFPWWRSKLAHPHSWTALEGGDRASCMVTFIDLSEEFGRFLLGRGMSFFQNPPSCALNLGSIENSLKVVARMRCHFWPSDLNNEPFSAYLTARSAANS